MGGCPMSEYPKARVSCITLEVDGNINAVLPRNLRYLLITHSADVIKDCHGFDKSGCHDVVLLGSDGVCVQLKFIRIMKFKDTSH